MFGEAPLVAVFTDEMEEATKSNRPVFWSTLFGATVSRVLEALLAIREATVELKGLFECRVWTGRMRSRSAEGWLLEKYRVSVGYRSDNSLKGGGRRVSCVQPFIRQASPLTPPGLSTHRGAPAVKSASRKQRISAVVDLVAVRASKIHSTQQALAPTRQCILSKGDTAQQLSTYSNTMIYLLWEQRVGGSNPSAPTILNHSNLK